MRPGYSNIFISYNNIIQIGGIGMSKIDLIIESLEARRKILDYINESIDELIVELQRKVQESKIPYDISRRPDGGYAILFNRLPCIIFGNCLSNREGFF
jgi:hypothetical protein